MYAAATASGGVAPAISLTDNALKHLNKMRNERNEDLCLRIGVKQGGCSGMSYTMEFEKRENARPDDSIIEYNGFNIGMCQCLSFANMTILVSFAMRRIMPHTKVRAIFQFISVEFGFFCRPLALNMEEDKLSETTIYVLFMDTQLS